MLNMVILVSICVLAEQVVKYTKTGSNAKMMKFASPLGFPVNEPRFSLLAVMVVSQVRYSKEHSSLVGTGEGK